MNLEFNESSWTMRVFLLLLPFSYLLLNLPWSRLKGIVYPGTWLCSNLSLLYSVQTLYIFRNQISINKEILRSPKDIQCTFASQKQSHHLTKNDGFELICEIFISNGMHYEFNGIWRTIQRESLIFIPK